MSDDEVEEYSVELFMLLASVDSDDRWISEAIPESPAIASPPSPLL